MARDPRCRMDKTIVATNSTPPVAELAYHPGPYRIRQRKAEKIIPGVHNSRETCYGLFGGIGVFLFSGGDTPFRALRARIRQRRRRMGVCSRSSREISHCFLPSSNAGKSTISDDAVIMLLSLRSPTPEGAAFKAPVSNVPAWIRPLLWPFIALSAIGLGLSLWVHLVSIAGRKVAPHAFIGILHVGIFVVWFPAVLVAIKRVGNTNRKDFWKVVVRGSPEWVRYMVYGFLAYAVVNFLIFIPSVVSDRTETMSVTAWRAFSGHWMAFYSAALAILYSASVSQKNHALVAKAPPKIE